MSFLDPTDLIPDVLQKRQVSVLQAYSTFGRNLKVAFLTAVPAFNRSTHTGLIQMQTAHISILQSRQYPQGRADEKGVQEKKLVHSPTLTAAPLWDIAVLCIFVSEHCRFKYAPPLMLSLNLC